MVKQAEVFLDLRVPGVVPINGCGAVERLEEETVIRLEGNFLDGFAIFDAEFEAELFGFGQKLAEQFIGALHAARLRAFAFAHGLVEQFLVFGSRFLSSSDQVEQAAGVVLQVNAPVMQHDNRRVNACSQFEGLARATQGVLAFAGIVGREAVKVRSGGIDAHRQRAKIMKAGDFDFAGFDGFNDARQEADARAVAQFRVGETEVADFAQHGAAVNVAMGVPAG